MSEPSPIAREAAEDVAKRSGVDNGTHWFSDITRIIQLHIDRATAAQAEQIAALKADNIRDGNWLDQWGSCKVCNGEIPHGHAPNCDVFKLEQQVRTAQSVGENIAATLRTQLNAAKAEIEGMREEFGGKYIEVARERDQASAAAGDVIANMQAVCKKVAQENEQLRKERDELRAVLLKCRDTVGIYISCAGHHSDGDDPCPRCQIASQIDGALALHTTSKPV